MSTVVDGLIKIGKTGSDNFSQRMTYLESNGYRNVSGLKRQFAIELSGYEEKERLLDSLFSRSRVSIEHGTFLAEYQRSDTTVIVV